MLSIAAIVAVHNSEKTLQTVLAHLAKNGIDAFVLDHGSTDRTSEILEIESARAVKEIINVPFDGVFRLAAQLSAKEEIARKLTADWIIHLDSDEIMESPREGESLRGMIERLSSENFDVIDCDEFVFVPKKADDSEPLNFIDDLQDYYYFSPPGRSLHRVQRRVHAELNWSSTGGHRLPLLGRRLSSERIRLRHYIGVSFAHLQSQYLGRVFSADELMLGWHAKRVASSTQFVQQPDKEKLFNLSRDGWRTDNPHHNHLLFHQATPYVAPKPVVANEAVDPVPFVVGVGRSGTTLLRLMLDAHPEMAIPPETHWLGPVLRQMRENPQNQESIRSAFFNEPSWADMGFSNSDFERILNHYDASKPIETVRSVYRDYAKRNGAKRYGDKTPLHGLAMNEIVTHMPEVRFIHIIRDGRDVALSYRDLWFGPGSDPRAAAIFWMWRIREIRQQAQFVPHYLEVRYENLVRNTEVVLREISNFIRLPFSYAQLDAHNRSTNRLSELRTIVRNQRIISAEQRQGIHALTAKPPDNSRIERWKTEMELSDLRAFESVAGSMLSDLGYEKIW